MNNRVVVTCFKRRLSNILGAVPDEDDDEPSTLTRPEEVPQRMPSS